MASTEEFPVRLPKRRQSLTQRIPLKLLGKKCSRTSRLVASSRVLQTSIPTRNCDIILTLPARTDDHTLMWLLARLRTRTPQIHVHVRHWNNTGVYAFYMTADYEDLLKGAESLAIVKRLKADVGGGMKEFVFEDQQFYEGVDDEGHFLSSEERQAIVYHMLLNLRALKGEKFESMEFLEGQPIARVSESSFAKEVYPDQTAPAGAVTVSDQVPLLESARIVSQVFPLHDKTAMAELRTTWVQSFFQAQPLDKVCDYFGVKIAMYFAYLGHYTTFLVIPTLVGIIFWFNQGGSQMEQDIYSIAFALFNMLWSSVYICLWRRRSADLAYRWGTLDKQDELLQDPRPLYKGNLQTSGVTGRLEPCYPLWKRNLFRYLITVPVIGSCLTVVFYVMLLIFQLQEWVNGLVRAQEVPSFCQFLPKIFLALVIWILDEIYKKIAYWLNNKENYRLEETYEKHLIIKLGLFQFVNSFLALFYIAFYLQDMNRLRDTLGTLLITRQVIGNIREAVVPYLLWKMKLMKVGYDITGHMSPHTLEKELKEMSKDYAKERDKNKNKNKGQPQQGQEGPTEKQDSEGLSSSEGAGGGGSGGPSSSSTRKSELILTQAELESTMKKYEDTFDDYLEMFIQYGYVILFSSAFPLAALFALLNNIIEIRSDAFKLCVHHQRPFGKRVRSIGIWLYALRAMGMVAVMVNIALIGVSGQLKRVHPDLDPNNHVIYILAIEHALLLLKVYISYAIPSQPQWIKEEMARLEFQRREALKSLEASPNNARFQPFFQSSTDQSTPSPSAEIHHSITPPFIPARHHPSHLSGLHKHSTQESAPLRTVVKTEHRPVAAAAVASDLAKDKTTESDEKISDIVHGEESESRLAGIIPGSGDSDTCEEMYSQDLKGVGSQTRVIPETDHSHQATSSNVPLENVHELVSSSNAVHFQPHCDECAIMEQTGTKPCPVPGHGFVPVCSGVLKASPDSVYKPVTSAHELDTTHVVRDSRVGGRNVYTPWSTKTETRQRILEHVRSRHSDTEQPSVKRKSEKDKE